jgi:uncharacterized protein YgfB (UPF0149 family)
MGEFMEIPSFDELDALLAQYGAEFSPADVHGLLSGYHCGGFVLSGDMLAAMLLESLDLDVYGNLELLSALQALNSGIALSLQSNDFDFALMIPDEGDFFERLTLFSRWCERFINGFSETALDEANFGEDIEGALEDLMTFSRLPEQTDETDQDEASLMDLQEYCKVAVLMLYTELVLIPLENAEKALQHVEQTVEPERRMPPSNHRH